MAPAGLRISRIELTSSKRKVDTAELTIGSQRHGLSGKLDNSNVLCADLDHVLEPASQGSFSLSVTCSKQGFFSLRKSHKVEFKPSEVLNCESKDNEFRKKYTDFDVVLKLSAEPPAVDTSSSHVHPTKLRQEVASSVNLEPLTSTIDDILQQCPRFRILVIGKSGVGKSSLINRTFGIKDAFAEHDKRGIADIKQELISDQNDRFILHDSKGFEHGDVKNLSVVKEFIQGRRNNQDIKEQLHAVWMCFQIPHATLGQRMMETGMEEFLQQKKEILGDVPTIFVFTKYDMITAAIESDLVDSTENYNPADVTSKVEQHLREHCIQRIEKLTEERNIPYIAVSKDNPEKLGELVQLTYQKVSEYFGKQPGVGTSPVLTLAAMAQRVAPDLKIEGSIKVGKERYWQAVFSGTEFLGRSMQDCLWVIHDDIVGLWNFCDEGKLLLSKEFRDIMINLVNLLERPIDGSSTLQRSETMSTMQTESLGMLVALLPITLPFSAGIKFVKWAYNAYKKTSDVQRNFMAYIADLTNILDILFTLTASRSEENLNIRTIKAAWMAYYGSMRRKHVHAQIRGCSVAIFGSSGVVSEIESIVRKRYVIDEELVKAIRKISPADLEGEEAWYSPDENRQLTV
ncbi:hypothetical protein J3A83DRAFT_4368789 [Scleroderma citrinum]